MCRVACQVCSGVCRVRVTSNLSVHLRRGLIKTKRWRLPGQEFSILEGRGRRGRMEGSRKVASRKEGEKIRVET